LPYFWCGDEEGRSTAALQPSRIAYSGGARRGSVALYEECGQVAEYLENLALNTRSYLITYWGLSKPHGRYASELHGAWCMLSKDRFVGGPNSLQELSDNTRGARGKSRGNGGAGMGSLLLFLLLLSRSGSVFPGWCYREGATG